MPLALRSLSRKPKPRTPPEADPRYARVVTQLRQKAARVKQHPTPAKKAGEAAAAAKGPPNEKAAGAKGRQVDKIKDAKTTKPEPASFLSLLRAEIEKAMPKTLDDTSKFMKGGDAAALKGGLKGNVADQKQQATGDTAQSTKQTPSQAGVPAKDAQPIPEEPAPPRPDVPAGEAMPAPKPDADVSVQDSKQDTEAAMADAEITETQCKKANDPRFSAVLEAKGQVAVQADAAPAQYRAKEKGLLGAAVAAARASGRAGAAAMLGVKGNSKKNVLTRQQAAKLKDEAERKKVADNVEAIYNRTKAAVEAKLSALDEEVNAQFDTGTDAAVAAMKAYTEERIDKYKDDRYSGLRGKARWIRDQFKGLPAAANRFYVEGRDLFARLMDKVIVRVANLVETRLREAKALVAAGQAEIKSYVDSLPKNLKAVGQAAQKEVADRFKELERGIEDKRGQLAQQLAQKHKEAFEKADKALKEIQDANKGLVQKFVDKLGEIIKIIREFKGKLMAALRKGWSVIKGILSDPIGFLGNLIAALKQGFNQFKANIETWLIKGIIGWLFGALAEAGVTPPPDFSLPSILKLVLQILGITYERIREKAVKLLGPTAVAVIERMVEYVRALMTGGPAALWEQVQGDIGDLKERVLGDIRNMIITEVIKAAVLKIVSMFNPVGAFIQAVLAIYNTVMFVIEQASRIAQLVSSVLDSVSAIASGAIGAAAKRIEEALGTAIPIVIGFLARLVGVGGLPKKATAIVKRVQTVIDKAIDKLLAKAVGVVKRMFGKGAPTGPAAAAVAATPAQTQGDVPDADAPLEFGGETHTVRMRWQGDRVIILMASGGFDDMKQKLDQIGNTYAGPFRDPALGLTKEANQIDAEVGKVKARVERAEAASTKKLRATKDMFARSTALRKDVHEATLAFRKDLAKLADKFTKGRLGKLVVGNAAKLKVGNTVMLNTPPVAMIVTKIKSFELWGDKYELVFHAEATDRSHSQVLLYRQEGAVWSLASKPAFVPFNPAHPGGANTVTIDKAHLNTGAAASHTPAWFGKTLGTRVFVARGHLIAKTLGGPGGADNIVPLTKKANNQMEHGIEMPINRDIKKNDSVYAYSAQAHYPGGNTTMPPDSVSITETRKYPNKTPTSKSHNVLND